MHRPRPLIPMKSSSTGGCRGRQHVVAADHTVTFRHGETIGDEARQNALHHHIIERDAGRGSELEQSVNCCRPLASIRPSQLDDDHANSKLLRRCGDCRLTLLIRPKAFRPGQIRDL